jgi:hypothetical protein
MVKQIISNNNSTYSESCFLEAIKLGMDFKLNQKVNEKHFNKKMLEKLIRLPIE